MSELRSRTGTLLAAASISASFLGAQAFQQNGGGVGLWEGLAIASLVVSICAAVFVLLPKRGFVFSLNAVTLYEALYVIETDEERDRRLSYWLEGFWGANQTKVDGLNAYFLTAAVTLVLQLVFWSAALAGNL